MPKTRREFSPEFKREANLPWAPRFFTVFGLSGSVWRTEARLKRLGGVLRIGSGAVPPGCCGFRPLRPD